MSPTLNATNVETLGSQRLAELLIEISTGNAAAKRRLRLELAGEQSPKEVAREVRKRLSTISRSRAFVDWQKRKALVDDLETQRRAIVEKVAPADPPEALELLWRFLGLADSIFERCDDGSGTVIGIFQQAVTDLAPIADSARPETEALAGQVFAALQDNGYGQYDGLIETLAPALGTRGLDALKVRVQDLARQSADTPAEDERQVIGWGMNGPVYADEIEQSSRRSTVRMALQEIADAQDDVDGFIAQYDSKMRQLPRVATAIAQRLLSAGRLEEAWIAINAVEEGRPTWLPYEWEEMRLEILEALGRSEEAQTFRWSCFERSLSAEHLRSFLKRLPDFDDIDAEERALDHAAAYPSLLSALAFLINWKAMNRVADLVLQRADELDGDHYEILTPAANALSGAHPLAATLVLRAMIDFALETGRSSRYHHAARHFLECKSLAGQICDFGTFEIHDAYAARLRNVHGRKTSFWSHIP